MLVRSEETWPEFLREWGVGPHRQRYEQSDRSDMTKVPCPYFDRVFMLVADIRALLELHVHD